jgi:hypothetical protein
MLNMRNWPETAPSRLAYTARSTWVQPESASAAAPHTTAAQSPDRLAARRTRTVPPDSSVAVFGPSTSSWVSGRASRARVAIGA